MRVVSYSEARGRLKEVIDQVVDNVDVTIISRRDAEHAVLMSLQTYESMMETLHLLKSPANARHLEKSIEQYRKNQFAPKATLHEK